MFKKIFISVLLFFSSLGIVFTWNGLIAENGDLLSLTKWNELVSELQTKISGSDLLAGTNINLTYSGSEVTIHSIGGGGSSIPYITTNNVINIGPSQTQNIIVDGLNFTPSSSLLIPGFDGTINSVTPVSPTQLQANVTAGTNEILYDLVVSNGGTLNTLWTGNGVALFNVGSIIGNGPAGTYTENFETDTLGNWTEVAGLTANVSFQTNSNGTPSNNTGPNNAAGGTFYIFAETSSPNYPNMTFAIETDNFRHAQNISFDYHMFGADTGVLEMQTYYGGTRTTRYTLNGQQQTTQASAWINTGNIDLSSFNVERIRLFYTSGNNYTGDASIDNIVITSI